MTNHTTLTIDEKRIAYQLRAAREQAAEALRHGYVNAATYWERRVIELERLEAEARKKELEA